jgi:hypothetical protein
MSDLGSLKRRTTPDHSSVPRTTHGKWHVACTPYLSMLSMACCTSIGKVARVVSVDSRYLYESGMAGGCGAHSCKPPCTFWTCPRDCATTHQPGTAQPQPFFSRDSTTSEKVDFAFYFPTQAAPNRFPFAIRYPVV